jgi:hypothetical protein
MRRDVDDDRQPDRDVLPAGQTQSGHGADDGVENDSGDVASNGHRGGERDVRPSRDGSRLE